MFDQPSPVTAPRMQRVRGRASVALSGESRLERLAQAGSAKAFLPRAHGAHPEIVFLNTAGGLTGGDRLDYAVALGPGGRAVATTQTAERAYRSGSGRAEMNVDLDVAPGARLDWLPQETILFDGAALTRRTRARLSGDAALLFAETVILGRAAMGETVATLDFTDRREVLRDGRPVMLDPLRIDGASIARGEPAGLGGARALATVALVARGAEDALGAVRGRIADAAIPVHASGWDGRLVVRAMAADATPLRRTVAGVLELLRGAPLPRVWQV